MRKLNYVNQNYYAADDKISNLRQIYYKGKFYDVNKVGNDYFVLDGLLYSVSYLIECFNIYATEYTLQKHT